MTADEINKLAYELKVAIRFTGITKPGTVHDLIDALRDAALRTASAEPSPEVSVEARGLPPRLTDFRLQELFDGCDFESMVTADDLFYIIARAVEKEVRAALAAQADARREDGAMLDWLDSQKVAYGFADVHEGNRWDIDGPFRTIRDAIRAAMNTTKGADHAE